jgi:hypothetical protein
MKVTAQRAMIETITQELAGTRARIVRDLTALDDARARAARQGSR